VQAIRSIDLVSLADTFVSLALAFVLGGVIGFERQYRQRTAGLRTNVLVAVGAAIFIDMGNHLNGKEGAVHLIAYVISGIGFLGAGVIMREEGNVRGLNTAATLWGSAAVGCCAGADLALEAILGAAFVLAANTLLRPVVNFVNRKPLDTPAVEASNTVVVIVADPQQKVVLRELELSLEQSDYPSHTLTVKRFGDDAVQIDVTLGATSVKGGILDEIVERIKEQPGVRQAYWNPVVNA